MVPDNAAAYVEVLETGRHSDFKIICKDVVFKVHRIVICAASTMLEKACNGGFSVFISSSEQPAQDANIL